MQTVTCSCVSPMKDKTNLNKISSKGSVSLEIRVHSFTHYIYHRYEMSYFNTSRMERCATQSRNPMQKNVKKFYDKIGYK